MKNKLKYLMVAFISMLIIITVSFIIMIFESGKDGLRTTFFDALYFESKTMANGNIDISMGFYDNFLIVLLIGTTVITLFIILVESIYLRLLNYKNNLKNEQDL
ncbi:MAG: hypothetical protein ACK5NF_03030 [Bacilli bacterium]